MKGGADIGLHLDWEMERTHSTRFYSILFSSFLSYATLLVLFLHKTGREKLEREMAVARFVNHGFLFFVN